MLYQAVFRYMCKTADKPDERIFTQETTDPQMYEIELTDTSPAFTKSYLEAFGQPLPEDETKAAVQDRLSTGWLAWGKKLEVSRMTGWNEFVHCVDDSDKPGIERIRPLIESADFWKKVSCHLPRFTRDIRADYQTTDFWSQEETRTHLSATHIDLVVASVQLYPNAFDLIRPIVDEMLAEMERTNDFDRHKTRAMWEVISGLVRGSDDWSGKDRKAFWDWLAPKLPELFNNIRHDTTGCWDIAMEFILHDRDPRRYPALMDFIIKTAKSADFAGGSSFGCKSRTFLMHHERAADKSSDTPSPAHPVLRSMPTVEVYALGRRVCHAVPLGRRLPVRRGQGAGLGSAQRH